MPTPSVMAARTTAFLTTTAKPFILGDVLDSGCGRKPYKGLFPECSWTGLDARPVGDIEADFDRHLEVERRDTVLCTDALQFSRNPQKAVDNMAAALRIGGHLVITAPNVWHEDTISRWRFTIGGLGELVVNSGLEIVYLDGLTGLFKELSDDYRNTFSVASVTPPEFTGWIGHLDSTYPMLSACVAVKPRTRKD